MKKLAMVLSLVAMVALTSNVFAQEKGQIHFGLGGVLFESAKGKWDKAESMTTIDFGATGRYFVIDNLGLDLGLGFKKADFMAAGKKESGDLGIDLMIGAAYYYWKQDKMQVAGGLDIYMGLGDGNKAVDDKNKEKSPMSIGIYPAQFEYWPMEGGAVYASPFFEMRGMNLGDNGQNAFGLDLGIKIRLK